ncbi:diphosphomevalonate/mevalonate 3,5-bisphosphate decarboxylase family protein [Flagellimonas zhangzhouensis]|uniref:Diphosphomevalonate decarboxylase n=1 Tax=Flagellimonas zhangzhouensis TaxID=1073328 RepID=A0A1H2VJJ9_9FLAO|nr:diphosphomevalonate decarboxylase [Allomuricauda zhangzhouensis]SDQ07422.1 diphosphomevalonate decarboxylase [Allomuricauda zhangzhouensis]SDW68516.1 diphosphomevalonate decarboxylase [Allomuricauda zhangzhouensis]
MTEQDFLPKSYSNFPDNGFVKWKAPSNIALVKYWGKKPVQIPANPSVSFTLDTCATTTSIAFTKKDEQEAFSFDLLFEGKPREDFKPKIQTFFERVEKYLPFLKEYHFQIETSNSFPHSSGIASSASGMAALSMCLMDIEKQLNPEMDDTLFYTKASFLARLGSGSACRSVKGDLVQWGAHENIPNSSDEFGVPYPFEVHEVFKSYCDTILLVHKGEKQVSSTVGHNLMHGHPYAETRFQQAFDNLDALKPILAKGDLEGFIKIVESEALTLHAMMMTSMPYFILMKPNTLEIINKIWEYREETKVPVCFTLDAGANVHVLYPLNHKEEVQKFIDQKLAQYCENGQYINDQVGKGAVEIKG